MSSPPCPLAILSRQEISWNMRATDSVGNTGRPVGQPGRVLMVLIAELTTLTPYSCAVLRAPSVTDIIIIIITRAANLDVALTIGHDCSICF